MQTRGATSPSNMLIVQSFQRCCKQTLTMNGIFHDLEKKRYPGQLLNRRGKTAIGFRLCVHGTRYFAVPLLFFFHFAAFNVRAFWL